MADLTRLMTDLELLRSLAGTEQSLFATYARALCATWIGRIKEEREAQAKVADSVPSIPPPVMPPLRPLDMGGIPLDSTQGKADSR